MDKKERLKELRTSLKIAKKSKNIAAVLRIKCLIAYYMGNKASNICRCYDVSKKSLKRWVKRYESNGVESLKDSNRTGRPQKLTDEQLSDLHLMIDGARERVWLAKHIYLLIIIFFGVVYSVKYLPQLLRKIGLSFHKAVHYFEKANEKKRAEWIKEKLPQIYRDKIREGWRIFFQDEVGFQTEGTLTYTWAQSGSNIKIKNYGRHGRVNMLGVYEVESGNFFGKLTCLKINALRFKRFICCLKRKYKTDKFIIIADNASFHKAKWFTQWWKESNWLRLEFLPAYSPDFNPIERLWKWIKQEYTHNRCWKTQNELEKALYKAVNELPSRKDEYIGTMKKEIERLKTAFDFYQTPFFWTTHLPPLD